MSIEPKPRVRVQRSICGIDAAVSAILVDEISRFKVGGPMPIFFEIDHQRALLHVILRSEERTEPGRRAEFEKSEDLASWCYQMFGESARYGLGFAAHHDSTEREIRECVREALFSWARDAYEHELAEQFTRDGVRVFDPHAD